MKADVLQLLNDFKRQLQALRKEVKATTTQQISKVATRNLASAVVSTWVEKVRSPLEYQFKIDAAVIAATAEQARRLNVLARPNNQKSSYLEVLNELLDGFDDKFVQPIELAASEPNSILQLDKLIPALSDVAESDYLSEAIKCARNEFSRAAMVMGWCAAISHIQRKVMELGFNKFNATSKAVKAQTSGKFKRWNKEFNITTESELQEVFDTDLIVVVENMGLLDSNESQRLERCFEYRNQSAHPGRAPIEPIHVVAFFTDVVKIVLANPKFVLSWPTPKRLIRGPV